MKKPRIAFSDAAIADILEQSDWYEAQADRSVALLYASLRISTSPCSLTSEFHQISRLSPQSVVPQRNQWIHARRSMRRHQAGEQRHDRQQTRNRQVCKRICRFHAE